MITDDDLQMLDLATRTFGDILGAEGALGDRASRCDGWSTRDVANHVLGGAVRYAHYFTGGDPSEVAWTRTADLVGDDAVEAHRRLTDALRREFVEHRDDDELVLHHPIRDVDVSTLLVLRVQELLLHGWDIASVADPDVELDPRLCRFVLDRGEPVRAMLRGHGVLGEETAPGRDGSTAAVLAAWGRA
ncbi:maleylpyruvate isomerase N-terminal domain-containing protein [Rhodococcus phenolicus]|uniref:maleylpyruvate isomerase N-terminal domain-containing protein n=1 Tax=Rhodococcus phenolicus TaxID=263849 RepID=UPI00083729CC|nr:maleylpyruvate isomerase N-terminal domain-containing protein [Rhodococcus phenolicus]